MTQPRVGFEAASVRVLGIDPGSLRTGFGVLDAKGPRLTYVASGVIRTQNGEFAERLCEIFRCVQSIVAQYQPQEIAIERVFVNRNPDSALKLGQARGAAILLGRLRKSSACASRRALRAGGSGSVAMM